MAAAEIPKLLRDINLYEIRKVMLQLREALA